LKKKNTFIKPNNLYIKSTHNTVSGVSPQNLYIQILS